MLEWCTSIPFPNPEIFLSLCKHPGHSLSPNHCTKFENEKFPQAQLWTGFLCIIINEQDSHSNSTPPLTEYKINLPFLGMKRDDSIAQLVYDFMIYNYNGQAPLWS